MVSRRIMSCRVVSGAAKTTSTSMSRIPSEGGDASIHDGAHAQRSMSSMTTTTSSNLSLLFSIIGCLTFLPPLMPPCLVVAHSSVLLLLGALSPSLSVSLFDWLPTTARAVLLLCRRTADGGRSEGGHERGLRLCVCEAATAARAALSVLIVVVLHSVSCRLHFSIISLSSPLVFHHNHPTTTLILPPSSSHTRVQLTAKGDILITDARQPLALPPSSSSTTTTSSFYGSSPRVNAMSHLPDPSSYASESSPYATARGGAGAGAGGMTRPGAGGAGHDSNEFRNSYASSDFSQQPYSAYSQNQFAGNGSSHPSYSSGGVPPYGAPHPASAPYSAFSMPQHPSHQHAQHHSRPSHIHLGGQPQGGGAGGQPQYGHHPESGPPTPNSATMSHHNTPGAMGAYAGVMPGMSHPHAAATHQSYPSHYSASLVPSAGPGPGMGGHPVRIAEHVCCEAPSSQDALF